MNTALPLSDFRRLYREIVKDGDGVVREDMTYQREREECFYRLGHDVSGIAAKVKPNEHHGSVARARNRVGIDQGQKIKEDMAKRKKDMEVYNI
jgi:hypothetical protein